MFKGKYRLSNIFTKYYKLTLYHNPKPSFYFKVGLFGKLKVIPRNMPSTLEEATKEEICECVEEEKEIERCSEERENKRRHHY